MSKSGSRYGRRSNWFKIHCLLQEQQQAQQAAHQNGHQKPPALSPNSLNMMRHPSYSSNLFSRPPCTKEELMMLRLDEYVKHPAAASSPSISSPDSHNSDSSIEIGDKRNSILSKQSKHAPNTQHQQPSPLAMNKDLFLPLPFAGFPLMPPPGFLPPPTHFLFSSYHNALYEQNHHLLQQQVQQGLLKTSDLPLHFSAKSQSIEKVENSSDNDDDEVDIEKHVNAKRSYSEALLESQRKHMSLLTKLPKRSHSPRPQIADDKSDDEDIDMNESDEVLTPPRSPKSPRRIQVDNNPIDLSMKSGSSTKSDDINHNYYKAKTNNKSPSDSFAMNGNSDSDSSDHKTNSISRKTIHCHDLKEGNNGKHFQQINRGNESEEDDVYRHNSTSADDRSDDVEYERELKRRKLHLAAPLDLTTKV
jgi:nuclear receptor subfamily 0 group A